MKKCVSWFLTLAMLLSLLPGAAFGVEPETEPDTEEIAAPVQVVEEPEPKPYVPEEPRLSEDTGDVELMAGSCTVSGTVSLPSGAKAESEGILYAYLYTQPVLDANGQVLAEAEWAAGARVTFSKGATSGSFTFNNVAPGSYVLRTYSSLHTAGALSDERYYNADGSIAANVYAATPLKLTSGSASVKLTLPKAERTISGTLTFDTPAPKDIVINLNANKQTQAGWKNCRAEIPVKRGATSVDFNIGVEQGNYYLQFRNDETDAYGYAGLYDVVSNEWSQRMYFNTRKASVTGLRQNGTALLGGGTQSGLEVSVTLPAAQTQERKYLVAVLDEHRNERTSTIITVKAGETSLVAQFGNINLEQGERFCVGYADVTDASTYWNDPAGMRYGSDDGITTQMGLATFYVVGQDTRASIKEPACYAVTGSLTRTDGLDIQSAAYAFASFEDGERYAARVLFPAGETTAQYTIYVPQSQKNQFFTTSAGMARDDRVVESTIVEGLTYQLSGAVKVADISVGRGKPTIQGRVSLPKGMTAPKGGLIFEVGIYVDGSYRDLYEPAAYYLPEGKSSFAYELIAPVKGGHILYAELSEELEGLYYRSQDWFEAEELTAANMTMPEAVTVSGTLTVPESCREGKATIQVTVAADTENDSIYEYDYVSVPAGEVSGSYSLQIPKGMEVSRFSVHVQGDSQDALDTNWLYLQQDGTLATNYAKIALAADQDITVDAALSRGRFLSGTLSLAEGMSEGTYSGSIRVAAVDNSWSRSEHFEFTGTSYGYKVSVPNTVTGPVRISLYVYEGKESILYQDFYYSTKGMTTDRDKATPVTVGENGLVLDLTMPKAKIISGQFVSADGGAVKWDPEQSVTMWLFTEDKEEQDYRAVVDAQGNWSISVDPALSGDYGIEVSIYPRGAGNIVRNTYYYSNKTQAVTDQDQSGTLTIGASDMTGVKLYVETGWMITGSLVFPEGGYFTGGDMDVNVNAQGKTNGYSSGNGELSEDGGWYCIVVPKTEDTYTIRLNSNTPGSHISTNLCITEQKIENVAVKGDTKGPSFTLEKAKAIISGTVYRPEGSDEYASFGVYLKPGDTWQTYNTWVNIRDDEESGTFSIPVPESEQAETFQLYYCGWGSNMPEGAVRDKNVYVCQDRSLTTDSAQAGNFPVKDTQFSFTLLAGEPFAKGKIYIPDGMTSAVTITMDYTIDQLVSPQGGFSGNEVEIYLSPDQAQVDSDGRRYIPYALSNPDMGPGSTYKLSYGQYYDHTHEVLDWGEYYLNEQGESMSYSEAPLFTVKESGANIVDFTPRTWYEGSEDYVLQSPHGINKSLGTVTYTYTYPAQAESLTLTFSKRTDTNLVINGTEYSGYFLAEYPLTVDGNTVTIQMTPAWEEYEKGYGFAVESIVANGTEPLPEPAPAAIYTQEGSEKADVISGLQKGQPVQVTLVSDSYLGEDTTVVGVIYNAKGQMLEFVRVPVDLNDNSDTAQLLFTEYGQAVTLKILLTDGDWTPEMKHLTFSGK